MFEAYLTHESTSQPEPDDIPQTKDPVWILGKKYNAMKGNPRYTFSSTVRYLNGLYYFQNLKRFGKTSNLDCGIPTEKVSYRSAIQGLQVTKDGDVCYVVDKWL